MMSSNPGGYLVHNPCSFLITVTVNPLFPGRVGTIDSIGVSKNHLQIAGFDDELCDVM